MLIREGDIPMGKWFQFPLRSALKDHFVLEICISDFCNLSCTFCCHATAENTNKRTMLLEDISLLSRVINDYEFLAIKISGGEPTIHPEFETIVRNMKASFKSHFYCLATNGKNLLQYRDLLGTFDSIEVSHYPGKNDQIVDAIRAANLELPVDFIERIEGNSMHNVFEEPNQEKQNIFLRCRYPAWKKVVQGRIYPCSNIFGQAIRQGFDPNSVSVSVSRDWREAIKEIDIEQYCRRCWVNVSDPCGTACRLL